MALPNADQSDAFAIDQTLPEPLPASPLGIAEAWIAEATENRVQPNPTAMALATIDPDGTPSVRMVLCRRRNLADDAGYVVFFTNYTGRKARALDSTARASVCFHWDTLDRQVRIEGPVVRSSAVESDEYYASRPVASRVGAWASDQSTPVASRAELLAKVDEQLARFNVRIDQSEDADIPRPDGWGGYRIWARAVELWVGGRGRIHDRARWERELTPVDEFTYRGGPWSGTRLQP